MRKGVRAGESRNTDIVFVGDMSGRVGSEMAGCGGWHPNNLIQV